MLPNTQESRALAYLYADNFVGDVIWLHADNKFHLDSDMNEMRHDKSIWAYNPPQNDLSQIISYFCHRNSLFILDRAKPSYDNFNIEDIVFPNCLTSILIISSDPNWNKDKFTMLRSEENPFEKDIFKIPEDLMREIAELRSFSNHIDMFFNREPKENVNNVKEDEKNIIINKLLDGRTEEDLDFN